MLTYAVLLSMIDIKWNIKVDPVVNYRQKLLKMYFYTRVNRECKSC